MILTAVLSGDRSRNAGGDNRNAEPETTFNEDMPVERLLDAELAVEPSNNQYVDSSVSCIAKCQLACIDIQELWHRPVLGAVRDNMVSKCLLWVSGPRECTANKHYMHY